MLQVVGPIDRLIALRLNSIGIADLIVPPPSIVATG